MSKNSGNFRTALEKKLSEVRKVVAADSPLQIHLIKEESKKSVSSSDSYSLETKEIAASIKKASSIAKTSTDKYNESEQPVTAAPSIGVVNPKAQSAMDNRPVRIVEPKPLQLCLKKVAHNPVQATLIANLKQNPEFGNLFTIVNSSANSTAQASPVIVSDAPYLAKVKLTRQPKGNKFSPPRYQSAQATRHMNLDDDSARRRLEAKTSQIIHRLHIQEPG